MFCFYTGRLSKVVLTVWYIAIYRFLIYTCQFFKYIFYLTWQHLLEASTFIYIYIYNQLSIYIYSPTMLYINFYFLFIFYLQILWSGLFIYQLIYILKVIVSKDECCVWNSALGWIHPMIARRLTYRSAYVAHHA